MRSGTLPTSASAGSFRFGRTRTRRAYRLKRAFARRPDHAACLVVLYRIDEIHELLLAVHVEFPIDVAHMGSYGSLGYDEFLSLNGARRLCGQSEEARSSVWELASVAISRICSLVTSERKPSVTNARRTRVIR